MVTTLPLLDAEHAAFITSDGLSVNAASVGLDGFDNLARCVGCFVNAKRNRVTLLLAATPATAFLSDIRRNGLIAAVFCEPISHRTVQLKGSDARQETFPAKEIGRVQRFCSTLSEKLLAFGEPLEVSAAMLDAADEDLVAVTFAPLLAFSQTPGTKAGDLLTFTS